VRRNAQHFNLNPYSDAHSDSNSNAYTQPCADFPLVPIDAAGIDNLVSKHE
jgi:hypothetical protein